MTFFVSRDFKNPKIPEFRNSYLELYNTRFENPKIPEFRNSYLELYNTLSV